MEEKIKEGTVKFVDRQIKDVVNDLSGIFSKTLDEAIDTIKKYKLPILVVAIVYLLYKYLFQERYDDC